MHCFIVQLIFFVVERPLDSDVLYIEYIGRVGTSEMGVMFINWTRNTGNYDLSHYTVELFLAQDRTPTLSIVVSTENTVFPSYNRLTGIIGTGSTPAVILPVDINREVFARITTTSKCNQTSFGVNTQTIISGGM